MSAAKRFDAWVDRGPFTALDLGIFRILFAASSLLLLPRPEAMSGLPDFLWKPPPGPFRLLDSPPPPAVVAGITVIQVVALVLVLLGVFTTASSIAAALLFVVADGLSNGYGPIYHYILLAVVPLVLCWAGWGRRLSVDARRRPDDDRPVPQWPLRLLALCIAVAFATAGLAKLRAGWLDLDSQSTRAHFVNSFVVQGNDRFMAPLVSHLDSRPLWELLDWFTVALELLLLVAVVRWTWFVRALPVLVAFHVGVLLVLSIAFAANVVAYGAFVRWSRWWPERPLRSPSPTALTAIGVGAAAIALGVDQVHLHAPATELYLKAAFVLAAGAVATVLCLRPRPARSTSG